jgi:hypothetical protein
MLDSGCSALGPIPLFVLWESVASFISDRWAWFVVFVFVVFVMLLALKRVGCDV